MGGGWVDMVWWRVEDGGWEIRWWEGGWMWYGGGWKWVGELSGWRVGGCGMVEGGRGWVGEVRVEKEDDEV